MNKLVLYIILVFVLNSCSLWNQQSHSNRYILANKYTQNGYRLDNITLDRIDKIISDSIDSLCYNVNFNHNEPVVSKKNLNNYYRQYSSTIFMNDTLVYITFIHKDAIKSYNIGQKQLNNYHAYLYEYDGSWLFNMNINLNTYKILFFNINGHN